MPNWKGGRHEPVRKNPRKARFQESAGCSSPAGPADVTACVDHDGIRRGAARACRPPPPVAITVVDVVAKLEGLAASHAEKLNWKVSIVDLLKLLGLDSSLAARKELAVELGCPPQKMGDSAQMNMWLHKTVLQKLAENGGNIPKDLLD